MRFTVRVWHLACLAALTGGCIDTSFGRQDEPVVESVTVSETFTQISNPKVDVLWIVDNTGSMAEEQAVLAASFGRFTEALEDAGLAWQLGVITTDVDSAGAGELQGNPWIITPESSDPADAFARAVSVGIEGRAVEAGLSAMLLALSEPLKSDANRGFRRDDAALHVIVVSDDDDASREATDYPLGDAVGDAVAFMEDEADATGLPAFFSAMICDDEGGCSCQGDAIYGASYVDVAEATGGVVSGICEGDLGAVVAALGELSITYPDTFPLQTVPMSGDVFVYVDGVKVDAWELLTDIPAVQFDEPPAPGSMIEVTYQLTWVEE